MISKKTKYALKALINLGRRSQAEPVLIADLAEDEMIPKKFLEIILLTMKNRGILHSRKGKGGGYYLAKSPKYITLGAIVRMFEGPLAPVPCVSETAYAKCTECKDEASCGVRLVMKDVRDAMAQILDNTTLAGVVERIEEAERQGEGIMHYYI